MGIVDHPFMEGRVKLITRESKVKTLLWKEGVASMEESRQGKTRNARRTCSRASLEISVSSPTVNTPVVNPVSDEPSKRGRSVLWETKQKSTTTTAGTTDHQFKVGDRVEVGLEGEGLRGSLFLGKVVRPLSPRSNMVSVEFETLMADDGKTPLKEELDVVLLRPPPPREARRSFNLSEEVDAYCNDGWWEGVITKVHEDDRYSVYFKPSREEADFRGSELRLHREWVYGKWVPPLDDEFRPGMLVEVRTDEDGFRGAWFAATIVEKLVEKNKYLVEYKDLRNDEDTAFVRQVADTRDLRPYPPEETPVVGRRFRRKEKVDVLYNDGWWVGEITKVVGEERYEVYFESTGDQLEYEHYELRPHRDWVNGEWV